MDTKAKPMFPLLLNNGRFSGINSKEISESMTVLNDT